MEIRPERAEDAAAIEANTVAAFADHPHSRQTEHLLVAELRRAGALCLSLVAEEAGDVVGHAAFSPVTIDGDDRGWVGAGPVSVRPDRQRRGIGSALMRTALHELRERGVGGCVLVGDPAFYGRFGFARCAGLTLDGVPPEVFLALVLRDPVPAGVVTFHPAFAACA